MSDRAEPFIATCDRMKKVNVMTEGEWYDLHEEHGEAVKSFPEPQPPSYRLARLTCPCGAYLVVIDTDYDAS